MVDPPIVFNKTEALARNYPLNYQLTSAQNFLNELSELIQKTARWWAASLLDQETPSSCRTSTTTVRGRVS